MLEYQKDRIHERTRLRSQGLSDAEIRDLQAAQQLPFRPAFENGKRRPRQEDGSSSTMSMSSFRRPG